MIQEPKNLEMHADYAKAFRVIRAAHGWQQTEMAKKLGISASQLSLIESGKRQPSLRVVNRLASATKVPSALVMLLASGEEDITDSQVSALAGALLKLLVTSGDPQRDLLLEET